MTTAHEITTPDTTCVTHRVLDDDTLLVGLQPGLTIRTRAAATLALEELLAAYAPRHVVLEVPRVPTPAVLSTVLRASRSCQGRGAAFSVVSPASPTRDLLRDALRAAGRVYRSTGEALAAGRGAEPGRAA
ncbi:hypothetical protein [Streptomyces sp. NPDC091268]|uniref:hypothetical protein n=1 Tax=Streptomyces sp. NPDC091268 TaxID=3365979 RepID=UPI003830EAE5